MARYTCYMNTKLCKMCRQDKPLTDFFKLKTSKDYYENRCKECKSKVNSASYQMNKERIKFRAIKKKYKLDEETYLDMAADGCYVCGSMENLCVDHDHSCCPARAENGSALDTCGNCVRGILCKRCNMVEGMFKKDPENIENLIKYMQKQGIIK